MNKKKVILIRMCLVAMAGAVFALGGCAETQNEHFDTFDILEKNVAELQEAMAEGRISSVELVAWSLDRIQRYDYTIKALITLIDRREAFDLAGQLDRERQQSGHRSSLHGIPVIVKDSLDVTGMPTTGGTSVFINHDSKRDAFLVHKLKEAGAIIIGKGNLDELQIGTLGYSTAGDFTKNPYAPNFTPGGSSAGPAVGIASGFAVIGIGADSNGSIRIPSANNNLCGLRPTRGLVSNHGSIPGSIAMAQGPMTRSMTDLAHTLDIIAGHDAQDPITERSRGRIPPEGYSAFLDKESLNGAVIGYVSNLIEIPADKVGEDMAQVLAVSKQVLEDLKAAGAQLVRLDVTTPEDKILIDLIDGFNGIESVNKARYRWERYLADHQITNRGL